MKRCETDEIIYFSLACDCDQSDIAATETTHWTPTFDVHSV
jgi:hypothetical protein